jgi:competence protein ComEC
VANLVAAPLVTVATVAGAAGVLTGVDLIVGIASWFAGAVLAVARVAADWPQLGAGGAAALGGVGFAATRPRLRPFLPLIALAVVVTPLLARPGPPVVPTLTFLDVGQGDAILIREPSGVIALVDGGRDPALLRDGLRRYGVRRIDLLVVTHGDDDHVGGLAGIFDAAAVGLLWVPEHPDHGPALDVLVDQAEVLGIPVVRIGAGIDVRLGELDVETLGPARRYASQNDGSIVLLISGARSALLGGDIEAVAQRELPVLRPDVMLVPHHGSSTTDVAWLADLASEVAGVSVGENSYGHPAPEVMRVLRDVGAEIHVTRDGGDVSIPLD